MTAQYSLQVSHFTSQVPYCLQEERPLPFGEYIALLIFPFSTMQTLHLFLIHIVPVQLIYSLCAAILIMSIILPHLIPTHYGQQHNGHYHHHKTTP